MKSILGNSRIADLTFYKSGRIQISSRIGKGLAMEDGDVIDIGVEDGEYYLYIKHRQPVGKHHAMVSPSSKHGGGFICSSIVLSRELLNLCGANEKLSLPCGEITQLPIGAAFPIITKLVIAND